MLDALQCYLLGLDLASRTEVSNSLDRADPFPERVHLLLQPPDIGLAGLSHSADMLVAAADLHHLVDCCYYSGQQDVQVRGLMAQAAVAVLAPSVQFALARDTC